MDAILDATAALVEEVGAAAVTVQAIGARAGASKGSMYHFFADRESVFVALAGRHVETLRQELADAREGAGESLRTAPVERAVEAFLCPIETYMERHPDLRRILAEPSSLQRIAPVREALVALVEAHGRWVVAERSPGLDARSAGLAAITLVAIVSAMRADRVQGSGHPPERLRAETRRVLAAYLASYPAGGSAPV
jgi:AcrR family transcriptional regulator